ncbi:MAG: hypothetical protein ACJAUH_002819 [Saprospiraceae bacterium]|jgi:hypothetical protein
MSNNLTKIINQSLSWFKENGFTTKAFLILNIYEIVFWLWNIRINFHHLKSINEMNPGLRGLINVYTPFTEANILTFKLLIISSLISFFYKWNYRIWVFKVSTFISLIFLSFNYDNTFYYIGLILLLIYYFHTETTKKTIAPNKKTWKIVIAVSLTIVFFVFVTISYQM